MTKQEIAKDSERRGEQRGKQKGIETGIRAMVSALRKLSLNQETVAQSLAAEFALPFQVAAEKVKQY